MYVHYAYPHIKRTRVCFTGKKSDNPDHESLGAINAALECSLLSSPRAVIGYRYLHGDNTIGQGQRKRLEESEELRRDFRVLDDKQVAEAVGDAIGRVKKEVRVSNFTDFSKGATIKEIPYYVDNLQERPLPGLRHHRRPSPPPPLLPHDQSPSTSRFPGAPPPTPTSRELPPVGGARMDPRHHGHPPSGLQGLPLPAEVVPGRVEEEARLLQEGGREQGVPEEVEVLQGRSARQGVQIEVGVLQYGYR